MGHMRTYHQYSKPDYLRDNLNFDND